MDSDSDPEMFPYNPEDSRGINPFDYVDYSSTPGLSKAIANNDIENVRRLLESGKSVNNIDNKGNTPLHHAAFLNRTELVSMLLDREDVIVDSENFEGYSPLLTHLKQEPDEEIVKLLLDKGANVNAKNSIGETILHMAVRQRNTDLTHLLIKRGADINAQDSDLFTPLTEAVHSNNLDAVCLLLYYDADVHLSSLDNLTPFMYALISLDRYEIATVLINYYDDFSLVTSDGYTPLLLAARSKNPLAVDLVKAGADVNYEEPDDGNSVRQLLLLSLLYDNLDFFKEVWYRVDHRQISPYQSFKKAFLCTTILLPKKEWLECIYLLLSSSMGMDLLCVVKDPLLECDTGSFSDLFYSFHSKEVDLVDRLNIMCIYLSFGYDVTSADLSTIYRLYGFNEELNLLLDHPVSHSTADCHPIVKFIFALEEEISTKYVLNLIDKYRTSYDCGTDNVRQLILHVFKFFSIGCNEKQMLLDRWGGEGSLLRRILDIPEVPSLVELSRNEIRCHLREVCKIKESHRFHDVMRRFPIPSIIKDILIFKKPLY